MRARLFSMLLFAALTLPACAGGPTGSLSGAGPSAAPSAPTRLVAAIRSAPPTMVSYYNTITPGSAYMGRLVMSGLTVEDDQGARLPHLAENVPTTDNGLWKVLSDGTMETTWVIRRGASWHDGTPFTSTDLAFTGRVQQDAELPEFANAAFRFVSSIETPDARTLVVRWKSPYIDADALFSTAPLPKHLLEPPWLNERKDTFSRLPYWTEEFVGTGPFKIREFHQGDKALLEAFDGYALGRPKIDAIEVRFIPDANTLSANILAGEVQLTLGLKNFSGEEAKTLSERWTGGKVVPADVTTVVGYMQQVSPSPPAFARVEFRRALMHALDRQLLADTFEGGLGIVPHGLFSPDQPEYTDIPAAKIVRYDYDPRRAAQLIESVGLIRGPDNTWRDGSGSVVEIEVRSNTTATNQTAMLFTADQWRAAGLDAKPNVIPQALSLDPTVRATYPAIEILGSTGGKRVNVLKSEYVRLPENNFRGQGGATNYPRVMDPRIDELTDRYNSTIPWGPRMEVAGDLLHFMTDQVVTVGLTYTSDGNMVSSRLQNNSFRVWNAHQWEVRN